MIHTVVLVAHSWLRWLVIVLGLAATIDVLRSRGAPGGAPSARLHEAFIRVLDVQLVLGLLLYVGLSPWVRVAGGNACIHFGAQRYDFDKRF